MQSLTAASIYAKLHTTVAITILLSIIYFSVSGLLLYRRFTKRLLNSIDLSPRIFSPTIHLPRHLLRRIWMDTWTTLLLVHHRTRPSQDKSISFVGGPDHLPQIREFSGSVGERHLENLKIMRNIGARKFRLQTQELSPEETLLRRKIYSFYSGLGNALMKRN